MPFLTAASNASSLQAPIPVSRSGVILGAAILPNGVSIVRPPANGFPPATVWQLTQSDAIARERARSICVKSCGSEAPACAIGMIASSSATMPPRKTARWFFLCIDQFSRILEISVSDRVRRPERQGAHGECRVVSGVLRKRAGAEHEQIRNVPTLQVPVEHAGLWIRAHDRAAVEVRGLIGCDVVGSGPVLYRKLLCTHRLYDRGKLVGQEFVLLYLVFLQIHRDPHQRTSKAILVGWIEIEIDVAVGVETAVHAGAGLDGAEIVFLHRLLPFGAPFGRSRRDQRAFDRAGAGLNLSHVAAADEAVRAMVEVVAVELVDAHADRAGGDERIEVELLVVEEAIDARDGLVGIITPDDPGIGGGIVGLIDPGMQQELHVEQRVGRQDHQIGLLPPFLAAGIDKGHAGGPFAGAIDVDPDDFRLVTQREIGLSNEIRQNRRLWTGLRIVAATEPFAEAAIGTWTHPQSQWIGVGLREISGWLREWLVAEFARGLAEQRVAERLRLCRRRIWARTGTFERIAALLDLPPEISRSARRSAEIFEAIVERFELVIGDAPVLDRHVLGKEGGAITLGEMRFQDEIGRQKPPHFGVPVHAAAANAVGRHECAPTTNWKPGLVHPVAESEGKLVGTQEKLVTRAIAQLVLHVAGREVGRRVPPWTTLEGDDVEPFVGEFVGHDCAGPAEADDDHIFLRKLAGQEPTSSIARCRSC